MHFTIFSSENYYSQVSCGICREDFKETERVVRLACEHIWHENCFCPSIQACPLCKKDIEDRTASYSKKYQSQFIRDLNAFMNICKEQIPEEFLDGYDKLRDFIITAAGDMNDPKIDFLRTIIRIASNLPEINIKSIAVEWLKEDILERDQEDIVPIFSNKEALFYSKKIALDALPQESKELINYLRQEINKYIDSEEIQEVFLNICRRYRTHIRTEVSSMNRVMQCMYFHFMTRSEFHIVRQLPEARRYCDDRLNFSIFLIIFVAGFFFFRQNGK